ncbi:glycosyltransferase family 2 protein [Engelhardtia mirabilis]|uniref:N-acetylglucosaminyl-diphospho-decaprenol L-rhamnosyltransferase n=1 Tax=Engelhardtia mirabilis TaxID=2528011 RepID=A0A518BIQ0_9BACT|nr:N-acetylglucosaminyl-diphospho-decaprenol L-rhamnosyltransferase [Planctomycetes bacterium Pla133]QDV01178.1 N-acetylglucosaminyl-diphospho-decaprenol L-rhamnosyltransferase [Planctomycetes bacterium Pla86]
MSGSSDANPSRPVSVVMPCLDDRELLREHLPPLLAECARRGLGDEVLVVDDTGRDALSAWLAEHFPQVRCVAREVNGGFARALLDGAQRARHELLFAMNPDILVHPGFLEPLIAQLAEDEVHSVVPKILLRGQPDEIESLVEIDHRRDLAYVRQRGLEGEAARFDGAARDVNYAIGGAMLVRRSEFVAAGGFDPLYEPFYYEDVDLGFAAWRAGRRVVYEPASVVEHHHRGTIAKHVDERLVVAVIERNRLLFQWRFLDTPESVERHLSGLYRAILDAHLRDERQELIWIALALEQLEALRESRARLGPAARTYDEVCERSRPS